MIKRAYEWYRIVNPAPSEEIITARKLSVEALIKQLDESDDSLLTSCVMATVRGFDGTFAPVDLVEAILASIMMHQQAFPSDLTENALELRVCAAIAVGEIASREMEAGERPSDEGILAAALILCGFGLRAESPDKYVSSMESELIEIAHKTYQHAALEIRKRPGLALAALGESETPSDLETLWKEIFPPLKEVFMQLQSQAESDREELEILWWLYGDYSKTAKKHLKLLNSFEAALCAGTELADITSVPPVESVREMLIKAVGGNRTRKTLKPARLNAIVKHWNDTMMKSLMPEDNGVQALVNEYPALFPLTWLVSRIIDSGVKTAWSDEFEKKTAIQLSFELAPETIARQVFNERVAQHICART
jgi:hypothetical protein